MQVKTIQTFLLGALLSCGAYLMSGCSDRNRETYNARVLSEYMNERGNTKTEIDSVIKSTTRISSPKTDAARQSALDSMAYRDLFNETHLSKDSAVVEEFNEIASKINLENSLSHYGNAVLVSREVLGNALINDSTKTEEISGLLRNFPNRMEFFGESCYDIQNYQHYSDKCFYGKFFEKYGLMTGDFKSKFETLAKKIAPKQ